MKRILLAACAAIAVTTASTSAFAADNYRFKLVRSSAIATCAPNASATVAIAPTGPDKETMHIEMTGLAPNVDFDVFVTQVPEAPFGMAWYQGDMHTDSKGNAIADFEGRFNKETFVIATGAAPAPWLHAGDAAVNPPTAGAIHMFHLGIWFNSPADAVAAGCPAAVTPFNGDHTAGVQVLNSKNFAVGFGPLRKVQ